MSTPTAPASSTATAVAQTAAPAAPAPAAPQPPVVPEAPGLPPPPAGRPIEGQPTSPSPGPGGAAGTSGWIGIGVLVVLAALFAWALARKRAARRAELREPEERARAPRALEPKKERLEPTAAPAEREQPAAPVARRAAREEREPTEAEREAERAAEIADRARVEAKRLAEKARGSRDEQVLREAEAARAEAARARAEAEALATRADEEARRRKEEEEERKRAEYRARKEQEAAERERRRAEAEEAKRLAEEQAKLEAAQQEEARKRAEEEQRRKVEAEAGKTLAEGLSKTRGGFVAGLNAFLGRNKTVDESVLAELEEVLFSADIGVRTASSLLDFARDKVRAKDLSDADKLKDAMRARIQQIVSVGDRPPDRTSKKPYVLMVVGVNGSGKTTTIGKLAAKMRAQNLKVLLAAGDTFRAAATEQLEVWGQRADAPVVKGKEGSDPGAVLFDALKRGQAEGFDLVICDTAGRLHTKAPLMEELKRVKRVMEKALPGSPHETLLVLDSTNGQNAIAQAREFHAALSVDGIVLTKLDGTAKGGVVIGICDELRLPVRYIGIGEAVGDLRPFDPEEFVRALFD